MTIEQLTNNTLMHLNEKRLDVDVSSFVVGLSLHSQHKFPIVDLFDVAKGFLRFFVEERG